jgi:hypothetical protein
VITLGLTLTLTLNNLTPVLAGPLPSELRQQQSALQRANLCCNKLTSQEAFGSYTSGLHGRAPPGSCQVHVASGTHRHRRTQRREALPGWMWMCGSWVGKCGRSAEICNN